MNKRYHDTRLNYDNRRKILWSVLAQYFIKYGIINKNNKILDFGCGYCDFINSIVCKDKYAYDRWTDAISYVSDDTKFLSGDINNLLVIPRNSIDLMFASNVFEHLDHEEISKLLEFLKEHILTTDARIVILQPNFYYSYRNYFDDYTHKSIWTHVSLPDFLEVHGFISTKVIRNFLPLTIKSKFPVIPQLIWAYLLSPYKFQPGQMLVVADRRPV